MKQRERAGPISKEINGKLQKEGVNVVLEIFGGNTQFGLMDENENFKLNSIKKRKPLLVVGLSQPTR